MVLNRSKELGLFYTKFEKTWWFEKVLASAACGYTLDKV